MPFFWWVWTDFTNFGHIWGGVEQISAVLGGRVKLFLNRKFGFGGMSIEVVEKGTVGIAWKGGVAEKRGGGYTINHTLCLLTGVESSMDL